jgi:hypothetical protein
MKKLNSLTYLFAVLPIIALIVFFTACTTEGPMGPAGKDGANGTNGTNGTNGIDGKDGKDGLNGTNANDACRKCHTTANWTAKTDQYHFSKHFAGTSSSRNTKYCARCHTSNGFKEITGAGKFVVSNDIPNGTRIECSTCHKHGGFDFSDTLNEILSQTSPIYLNYNKNAVATDFGKTNNLCNTCHQIRGVTSEKYQDSATGAIKSFSQLPFFPFSTSQDPQALVSYKVGQSFSVHDGNQSNLFKGINGYEYNGESYTKDWKHTSNSCTDCHMNKFNPADSTGGHTLKPNKAECTSCHAADKLTPVQTAVEALRIQLAELLVARKVFKKTTSGSGVVSYSAVPSHDFYGTLFPTTVSTTKYATALGSNNTVDPKTGLVVYGNIVTMATDKDYALRIGRQWKYGELGAAYNYGYINSELSKGLHNPVYAKQLLQKSIDWLNANP